MKIIFTIISCFFLIQLTAQDWKTFTKHKKVLDIETEGNTLWIATSGGLLNWNLQTDAYYKLTTEDGLISNQINAIGIDTDGNKWLATSRGVSMMDGTNITNYNSDNGLFTDYVNSVVIDSEGNKWFGTKNENGHSAVSKLDNQGNWSTIPESIDFGITCLTIDDSDNIYMGRYKQIVKYTSNGDWTIFVPFSPESIGHVAEMIIDENQELWAVSGDGLYHFDNNGNQTIFDTTNGLIGYPRSLFIDSNQTKWIGTFEGISKMNSNGSFTNHILNETVFTVFEKNENILLGTDNDVTIYNGNTWDKLTTEVDLAGNAVRGLDIANDGSVWMGTDNGISKFSPNSGWTTFTENDGLVCDPGYSLLATSHDELIISHRANCQGISIVDILTGEASLVQNDTFLLTLSLNEDANGNVWVGNYAPFIFENTYATKISPNGDIKLFDFSTIVPIASNNKTTGISIHPNGDVYFSTRWGIYYIDTNDEIHLSDAGYAAATIFIDSQESIWLAKGDYFGPSHILEKLTSAGDHIIYQNSEINDFLINEIIEDDQQNIWIASENGLFKLSPDEIFTRYSTLDGLADNHVLGIEFDANGNMWICTMNGVSTTASITTAISNVENKTIQLQLFPNPILTTATLDFDLEKNENIKVEISNVAGQLLLTPFDGKKPRGNHQLEFDVSNYSQGIYFCKVRIGGQSQVLKFVKM